MDDLKTSPELLERLKVAARRQPEPGEIERQRVSYIMGAVKDPTNVTESRIRDVLAKQEGVARA